jgi:exopolysaccharide biosynthesis polyprenyl glycosylphosphotransferase
MREVVRGSNTVYFLLLVASDIVSIVASYYWTSALRIGLNTFFPKALSPEVIPDIFPSVLAILLLMICVFALSGMYNPSVRLKFLDIFFRSVKAVVLSAMVIVVSLFLFTRHLYSRSLIVLFCAVTILTLTLARPLAYLLIDWLKARGVAGERVAITGITDIGRLLRKKIEAMKGSRLRFCGYVVLGPGAESSAAEKEHILGAVHDLAKLINEHNLNRIIVSEPAIDLATLTKITTICHRMGVQVDKVPDLLGFISLKVGLSEIDGIPLIGFKSTGLNRWDQLTKRSADIAVSLLGLVLLMPLLGIIALAVKLTSRGPVFFVQERIGQGGKHFRCYKFRSMHTGAEKWRDRLEGRNEAGQHIFKMRNDPRVTLNGRIMRRFSLDELPQLWNILKGDMSLVGPRPLPLKDLTDIGENTEYAYWLERRQSIPPGATGLWQINGRSLLPFKEMVKYDLFYIENWSLWLDLQIFMRTIPVVLVGRGAY